MVQTGSSPFHMCLLGPVALERETFEAQSAISGSSHNSSPPVSNAPAQPPYRVYQSPHRPPLTSGTAVHCSTVMTALRFKPSLRSAPANSTVEGHRTSRDQREPAADGATSELSGARSCRQETAHAQLSLLKCTTVPASDTSYQHRPSCVTVIHVIRIEFPVRQNPSYKTP
jgi:hypothetical protein